MNHRLCSKLDKIEQSLNEEEITRLWLKTIRQFRSPHEYLTSVLRSQRPEDLLTKRRVVGQRRVGSRGSHRGDHDLALAQAERVVTFAQNLVLELNCEVQRAVGECRERLDNAAGIVNLVALLIAEVPDSGNVARSRAPAYGVGPPAVGPSNRAAGELTDVIARNLTKARAAITDAMIDLGASALTAESMSRRFWNLDLLFRSVAVALARCRRLVVACADDFDRAVTRIRGDRHRSWSAMVKPATTNRRLVEKAARESSALLSNKLRAFARASMLASFGDVEGAKLLSGPYIGEICARGEE